MISGRILLRLAIQNLGRRPTRTALSALAVAVAIGAVFTTLVVRRSLADSLAIGFARMGADLIVVPRQTLVNLTPALLTVEPTEHTLDPALIDVVARLPGVESVAAQTYYRLDLQSGGHQHGLDLIGFDPHRDFTVLPWVVEKLDRPWRKGDLILGARREGAVGTEMSLFGKALTVSGKLGLTGVGPFDRSLFLDAESARELARAMPGPRAADPSRVSALLVRLSVGVRAEEIRFALAERAEVKVIPGATVFTSARHTLSALLWGAAFFTALLILASVLMVSVVYSAILGERRRELGLLLAVGGRPWQLLRLILTEAVLTTLLGGLGGLVLGGALILLFHRSLGYYFQTIAVPVVWPDWQILALDGGCCVALAGAIGLVGAFLPAWRTSRAEPYLLVRAEGN